MPLLLLLAGLILVVTGVKGTVEHLGGLLGKDFTGQGNFFGWVFAIALAGGVGYVPQLRAVSSAFLVMIIVAIFVRKGADGSSTGRKFFEGIDQALKEINSGTGNGPATGPVSTPSGGGFDVSTFLSTATKAASLSEGF